MRRPNVKLRSVAEIITVRSRSASAATEAISLLICNSVQTAQYCNQPQSLSPPFKERATPRLSWHVIDPHCPFQSQRASRSSSTRYHPCMADAKRLACCIPKAANMVTTEKTRHLWHSCSPAGCVGSDSCIIPNLLYRKRAASKIATERLHVISRSLFLSETTRAEKNHGLYRKTNGLTNFQIRLGCRRQLTRSYCRSLFHPKVLRQQEWIAFFSDESQKPRPRSSLKQSVVP